jgi:hypothetical protein
LRTRKFPCATACTLATTISHEEHEGSGHEGHEEHEGSGHEGHEEHEG